MRARGVPLTDAPDGFDAAEAGQGEIHDDEIGPRLLVGSVGLGPVRRFGDDAEPLLLLKQRAIAFANDRVIVDEHDFRQSHRRMSRLAPASSWLRACCVSVYAPWLD